jgi:hypothetical protein
LQVSLRASNVPFSKPKSDKTSVSGVESANSCRIASVNWCVSKPNNPMPTAEPGGSEESVGDLICFVALGPAKNNIAIWTLREIILNNRMDSPFEEEELSFELLLPSYHPTSFYTLGPPDLSKQVLYSRRILRLPRRCHMSGSVVRSAMGKSLWGSGGCATN